MKREREPSRYTENNPQAPRIIAQYERAGLVERSRIKYAPPAM